jgi:DNA-binding Lrp family transcriptional regulator
MNVTKAGLDEQERKIVRELIRDPRSSDNEVSRRSGVPVMTVNRKRKRLEEEGLLRYYVSIDKGEFGLRIFSAKRAYIIKLRIGITRKSYIEVLEEDAKWRMLNSRFISQTWLGESEGHLAMMIILDAPSADQLVEEFNGRIVPFIRDKFGADAIVSVETISLDKLVRIHHNYMPAINMENGKIKKGWPDELIFVDEVESGGVPGAAPPRKRKR